MKSVIFAMATLAALPSFADLYYGSNKSAETRNVYCYASSEVPRLLTTSSAPEETKLVNDLNAMWSKMSKDVMDEYHTAMADKQNFSCDDTVGAGFQENLSFELKASMSAKIMSVLFQDFSYRGGAHGGTNVSATVFNTSTGQIYHNVGEFVDNSNLADFKKAIREALLADYPNVDFTYAYNDWENAITNVSQLENFYITDNAIVMYFQPYEVMPYSEGLPEAKLYLINISSLLKKTGAVLDLPKYDGVEVQ